MSGGAEQSDQDAVMNGLRRIVQRISLTEVHERAVRALEANWDEAATPHTLRAHRPSMDGAATSRRASTALSRQNGTVFPLALYDSDRVPLHKQLAAIDRTLATMPVATMNNQTRDALVDAMLQSIPLTSPKPTPCSPLSSYLQPQIKPVFRLPMYKPLSRQRGHQHARPPCDSNETATTEQCNTAVRYGMNELHYRHCPNCHAAIRCRKPSSVWTSIRPLRGSKLSPGVAPYPPVQTTSIETQTELM